MTELDQNHVLLCTFRLGDHLLGIDVRDVQEILRDAEITPIPHTHAAIAGLINLRGQIATTIDLRARLQMPRNAPDATSSHVVVSAGGEQVSLLVDRIGEVLEVGPELYEPPPVTMHPELADLMIGTYKLEDELLVVVDVPKVVAITSTPEQEAA
ncbi:MAG: chemotaxis protein CheW [Actinomycetota bacterium]